MAITQNISDMRTNDEALAIIKNCKFIVLMNQQPLDRSDLQEMYSISDQLMEYITDQLPGTGLIYNGNTIIPMENEFDQNTQMYKLMDSKVKGKPLVVTKTDDDQDEEE